MPGSVPDPGGPEPARPPEPTRVLVVDDHPALREGLGGLLRREDGFLSVGALPGRDAVDVVLDGARPDVVVLDYALRRGDGLSLCFEIKQRPHPPGVVLYSAYADAAFRVPATLAQADAVVSKTAPVDELLAAVRAVARGERRLPRPAPEAMTAASSRLPASELPIAGMLFSGVSVPEIASTLAIAPGQVRRRALRILQRLQASDRREPAAASSALR